MSDIFANLQIEVLEKEVENLEIENARLKESIKRWENKEIHEAMNCYKRNKANAVWKEIAVEFYRLDPCIVEYSDAEEWDTLDELRHRVRELLKE